MIRVGKPYIEKRDGAIVLQAFVKDDVQGIQENLWFSTTEEYGQYFCDEVADAFVLAMILPALRTGQDIQVDAPVSERLWYNIQHSLLYVFNLSYGDRKIKVHADKTIIPDYHPHAVGCGCSLGVDSFATMLTHTSDECPASYRITHLTYFNVGAHGYKDLQKTELSYRKDLIMVQEFAQKINLPVVCIDSNLHIFYSGFDFDQSGDTRNMVAVLTMQKLFRRYLYASSYPIKDFKFTPVQTGYYETLLLPLMSTDCTDLVVANSDMSRTDKTRWIADNFWAQNYLYVCWKELIVNNDPNSKIALVKDQVRNCSRCGKCLRTLLALDVLGKVDSYGKIFDLKYWHKHKADYIARVLYSRHEDGFSSDLCDLMEAEHYKIPLAAIVRKYLYQLKIMGALYRIKNYLRRLS